MDFKLIVKIISIKALFIPNVYIDNRLNTLGVIGNNQYYYEEHLQATGIRNILGLVF